MDLNALKMFVLTARCGSLSAAARENNIPLPTLSRRIAELEHELDVVLLERTVKGCRTTEAGKKLLDQASSAIDTLNDAGQFLTTADSQPLGKDVLRAAGVWQSPSSIAAEPHRIVRCDVHGGRSDLASGVCSKASEWQKDKREENAFHEWQ